MRRLTPLFLALLIAGFGCQKSNSDFAARAGVYKLVLTNEQDAVIDAAQRAWEDMRKKDPQRASQFPEPRLAAQGMQIELKSDGKFVFTITAGGKTETLKGVYEFKDAKVIMTAEDYNGAAARSGNRVQEFDFDSTTNTISVPGPDGPQMFRR